MTATSHSAWPGRIRTAGLAVLLLALAWLVPTSSTRAAQAGTSRAGPYPEDAVKAVFLYRFAGYVQWPASALAGNQFTIAVLGGDAVAAQLRLLLPDHPIHAQAAQVRVITRIQQLGGAQMLYVGADYNGNLRALTTMLSGRPLLVVTDQAGGLADGGAVNFLLDGQHVRFEVSTVAARRSGLTISSALLAVAEHVRTGDVRPGPICGVRTGRHRHEQLCVMRVAGP